MTSLRSDEIEFLLERARQSIRAARDLLRAGYYDIVASRAYYAAFYAATALLISRNLKFAKHSGVLSAIHQHFVKTGNLMINGVKTLAGYSSCVTWVTMASPSTWLRQMPSALSSRLSSSSRRLRSCSNPRSSVNGY